MAGTGVSLTAALMFAYDRSLGAAGQDVAQARTMVLVTLTCASAAMTVLLSPLRTRAATAVAVASVCLGVFFVQVRPVATLLHLGPIHLDDWAVAACIAATTVFGPEILVPALARLLAGARLTGFHRHAQIRAASGGGRGARGRC